jgi:uncharacterized secreted protein with C-terminal beta-propeller domain
MPRPARNSRRSRSIMLETLQPRELMAFDAIRIAHFPDTYHQSITGEQWAEQILSANEYSDWTERNQPLDLKKFETEEQAKKFLTDALLKTWSGVLGKPVNNQLGGWYGHDRVLHSISDITFLRAAVQPASLRSPAIESASLAAYSTNNQVSSVDEADKFEISASGLVYTLGSNQDGLSNQVVVFDARDPSNLKKVATIDVSGWNTQMHLVNDQLILVSSDWQSTLPNGATNVQVFDVADPSNPKLQTSLKIAGSSQQSRFAAGQLTLYGSSYVSALRPLFMTETPNAVYTQLTETPIGRFESAEEFAARIQPLVVGWMLPDVQVHGSEVDLNNSGWDDLIASEEGNYRQQVSVLSFALNSDGLKLIDSEVLIGASMQTSYVDSNTVYITQELHTWNNVGRFGSGQPQTEIYAIEFDSEDVAFVAAGAVPGTIRDSRMMDEFEGSLRVFSESRAWFSETASTDLYILRPAAGKLEIIGQLTDVADGQALYSAYFDEDQAFITTWTVFQLDPLHGFDLSDPTNPREISELEIPGVSTYLQRIDENYLIGVGFVDVGDQNWRQQISLYDVSDLANFKVVDTWTSEANTSPNFRGWGQDALALNFNSKTGLLSIALSAFRANFNFDDATRNSLTVLKIETGESASITQVGQIGDPKSMALRSAVVGDAMLVISNAWLQSYAVDDLTNELDRELLVQAGVSDWIDVSKGETGKINVLENDYVAGGRVTAISDSTIGGTVRILDGTAIQYTAPDDLEAYWYTDTLTYTVTLENGESYTAKLHVNVYRDWGYYPPYIDPQPTTEIETEIKVPVPETTTATQEPSNSAYDINGDGETSPIDVLLVINHLNAQSVSIKAGETVAAMSESNSVMDTSKDGVISPIDALLIINLLNAKAALQAGGEASEVIASSSAIEATQANDAAIMAVLATGATDLGDDPRRTRKSR